MAGLVVAYLYRAQFRRRSVSSLMLWRFAVRSGGGGRRRDWLRTPPLFYLELLVLLLLLFAALSPHVRRSIPPPPTVVLDVSASMSARGADGLTPADRAARFLADELGKRGTTRLKVVAAPVEGPVVLGPDDAAAIAAGRYGDFSSPGDSLADAVARARRLATGGGEVFVLTDKAPPSGFSNESGVGWFAFGEPVANDAIAFASRTPGAAGGPDSLFAELRRFPAGDRRPFTLAVADPSRPEAAPLRFQVAPDAQGVARFATALPPGFGDAALALAGGDALACDDTARLDRSETPPLPVALELADAGFEQAVRRALDASGFAWRLTQDGEVPALAFSEAVVKGDGALPTPKAANPRFRFVLHRSANPVSSIGPYLADSASPFMTGVDFGGLLWPAGTNAPPGRTVLFAGSRPVIAFREAPGTPELGLLASGAGDALFRSTAWPILVWNALDYAAGLLPDAPERARRARPHRFPVSESDCTSATSHSQRGHSKPDLSTADFRPLAVWAGLSALLLAFAHQILVAWRAKPETEP